MIRFLVSYAKSKNVASKPVFPSSLQTTKCFHLNLSLQQNSCYKKKKICSHLIGLTDSKYLVVSEDEGYTEISLEVDANQ